MLTLRLLLPPFFACLRRLLHGTPAAVWCALQPWQWEYALILGTRRGWNHLAPYHPSTWVLPSVHLYPCGHQKAFIFIAEF